MVKFRKVIKVALLTNILSSFLFAVYVIEWKTIVSNSSFEVTKLTSREGLIRAYVENDRLEEILPQDLTFEDFEERLNCSGLFETERPIHPQLIWNNARTLYQVIVGKENSSIVDDAPNGFSIPVQAKQAPPKGRGIFAERDIAAGELIWSTKKTARFQDGHSYRKFIHRLEPGLACDAMEWSEYIEFSSEWTLIHCFNFGN